MFLRVHTYMISELNAIDTDMEKVLLYCDITTKVLVKQGLVLYSKGAYLIFSSCSIPLCDQSSSRNDIHTITSTDNGYNYWYL